MEDKKFELFYDVMKEMDKAYDNRVYNLFLTEEGMSIFRNHAQFEYQCYKRGFEGLKSFTYEELEIYLAIQRKINESFQRDVEESYDYFETDEK